MELSILMSAKKFAVVGASANTEKVGHQILRNLSNNPDLTIYPINLKAGTILGLPVYQHLWETPDPAEVVIISVPVLAVESVIDECIRIQAKAVILISSGFAEAGDAGSILQKRIVDKLHVSGIALLGPNTMGYIFPSRQIYASFGPSDIAAGPIALISQSGAMLSALFQEYQSANTGVSFAFSLGNRTGINENDALSYALNDPETKVIVMYLESLADPKMLLSIAKQITSHKPFFLLKGGVTEEGRSVAVSHTAALATSQVLLDDLCLQAGIIQVSNFEQLVRASVAAGKTTYLPENIMIVTNAGGPAVVLTDEITQLGIPLAKLSSSTEQSLISSMPELKINNPLDLLGDASSSEYQKALSVLSRDITIDVIVAIVTEQAVTNMIEITKILAKPWGKHLLFACLAGGDQMESYRQELKDAGVIVTKYPNEIAETIGALMKAKKRLDIKVESETIKEKSVNNYPDSFSELTDLIAKYGIQSPVQKLIDSENQLEVLKDLKYPLIAKTTNLKLLHKAKIGAVIQDIVDEKESKAALGKLQQWGQQVVFQQKIVSGVQVLTGAHNDPFWGWYMAVGLGGSLSDTYDDRAYIFLPASKLEFLKSLGRTKLAKLLNSRQTKLLVESIYRLQDCALSTKGLMEIEINPLFVTDNEVIAADLKRA